MKTRTITVRGVPDGVLGALRDRAQAERRSLNSEILSLFEVAVAPRRVAGPVAAYPAPVTVDREALRAVCRRYHIRSLAVFGSQARGTATPDSDIDVVVEFEPGRTPGLGFVTVAEALRPVFGGRRVDLVTRRGLAPRVRERILATAVPLYGA